MNFKWCQREKFFPQAKEIHINKHRTIPKCEKLTVMVNYYIYITLSINLYINVT